MNRETLIAALPPYRDEWVLVNEDQNVHDIISDIVAKHKEFAPYYDRIALYFDRDTVDEICNDLYKFCKQNIKYREENDKLQTTSIPTGILIRGMGDCKHYASFIGGILDGINRATGKKINWNYRFVSYNALNPDPHHVFIVVNDNGQEIWIDPTPGSDKMNPSWVKDRYIKKSNMALKSNIGNIGSPLAFAEIASDPAVQQSASQLITSVTSLFTGLLNSLGDKVPEYPIKSQTTLQKIMGDVQRNFPEPKNVTEANTLLIKAQQFAEEAYNKGGDVPITYGMIYDKVAQTLQNYIKSGGATIVNYSGANGGSSYIPPTPAKKDNSMLLLGGLGIAGFILLSPGKKTSGVSGMSTTNLLLLGVGGFLIFKYIKSSGASSGGDSTTQRSELINWIATTSDSDSSKQFAVSVFQKMTPTEISDTHSFIFDYSLKGVTVPASLVTAINAITDKYKIFT